MTAMTERQREKARLEQMALKIDEAIEVLNEAHSDLVSDRVIDAFGTDYVGEEDMDSILRERPLQRIAVALTELESQARKVRVRLFDFSDAPKTPPF